jgi:uncharacterized protein YdhG (YjbR/CyaY superfamily)
MNSKKTAKPAFTAEERAAMKERAKELKANARKEDAEKEVLAKIAELPPGDRALAERVHRLVRAAAPGLAPRTWYGQPAYADAEGQIVCFFQPASKFNTRYSTFGFNEAAQLDDGSMWPTAFALTELTSADQKKLTALVKRAAG